MANDEAPDQGAGTTRASRTTEREYVVLQLTDDETIEKVGAFTAATTDDACWTAVDEDPDLKKRAVAAGKGVKDVAAPKLAAVLGARFVFEEYVLEPIEDTRRVKRS